MPVLPHVLAASVTGPSHLRSGRPCQDAFAFRVLPGGAVAAAVADGLGSAPFAQLGAAIAVEAAVAACTAELNPAGGVVAARVALESAAQTLAAPLGDFACTLLVCLASRREVMVAHLGDGAAVVEAEEGFAVLSPPGDSEYVDEVLPLTAPGWNLETRVSRGRARALALFTDGCQRAALLRRGAWSAHPGWWRPLFAHARGAAAADDLARLLGGPLLSEHSGDDKTLLIAVLS